MDVYPFTFIECFYTIFVCVVGVFMMAFIVGGATSSLATMDAAAQKLRTQLDTINHYMRYRRVPTRLRKQVNAYFQYLWTCMRGLDDTDVMESMSVSISSARSLRNLAASAP